MSSSAPLLEQDDTLDFGEEDQPKGRLKHPIVTGVHIGFRTLALVIYLFCGWSSSGFIAAFVTIVLLLALDFWTVKNITGRIMVGLRWWNYIDDEGKSHWVFEAKKGGYGQRFSPYETKIFWTTLVAFPVLWTILLLVAFFSFNFKWAMLVLIAVILSGSNMYGYLRCKIGKSESLTDSVKNMAGGLLQKQMMANVTSLFTKPAATPGPANIV